MHLKDKFNAGEFVILAEIEPPKGVDISGMVANATRVKGKADALLVPEMSNAVMRMSSLGGAMILQDKVMETVMQVNCRDRNRLALQADLLAASACGINGIMAVTGEEPSFGDHQQTKAVYDIDLPELLDSIYKLQQGRDMAGIDLCGSPQFLVGSTVNPGFKGMALELELTEMKKKIDAGVEFFITPPLFDLDSIDPFLKMVDHRKTHIIPTVLLLKSVGMARYIDRNMDHVHISTRLIKRLQKAPDKVRECIKTASEMVSVLKQERFSGVLLSTIGWEDRLAEIIDGIKG